MNNIVLSESDFELERLRTVVAAAREVDRRVYHRHLSQDGEPRGSGGCFSISYETCGEHHAHDATCISYPRWCRKPESDESVNALHDAIVALDAVKS